MSESEKQGYLIKYLKRDRRVSKTSPEASEIKETSSEKGKVKHDP